MKKIKQFFKDKKIYLLNILLILIIFTFVLLLKKIYPFGEISIAQSDAELQYQPMLYNFIEKIRNNILEPYTFNNGFGAATAFNYVYYLSSPLNILSILFKSPNSIFLFTIISRVVLTGIISLFYFKKKSENNFIALLCSLAYTFCGWFIAYHSFNIWLDVFMIFPLFHYGLEQLTENNKCKIYIFTLAYILISNFYIAFAICIYTLLYYLYHQITKKEKYFYRIKSFQIIMFSTIIAFLLCFLHLYLVYDSFIKIGILKNNAPNLFKINILNCLSALFYGQYNFLESNIGTSFPNIGLNSIFIMSLIYYFFNKEIKLKDKIKTIIITALIIFIIFSKQADFILNAFHVTIGFSYRYSFIICFLMIHTFVKNFKTFNNKIDKKIYLISLVMLILLTFLYIKDIVNLKVFISNLAFILSYNIFFIFYNNKQKYKYILIPLMVIETICAFTNRINLSYPDEFPIQEFKVTKYRSIQDISEMPLNYNLYKNENVVSQFTSMGYKEILQNNYLLDIASDNGNILTVTNSSSVFDMFFNIKGEYYLEKIFAVDKNYKDFKLDPEYVTFNNMIEKSTGYKNALILLSPTYTSEDKIIYEIDEDGKYRVNFTTDCKYEILNPYTNQTLNIHSVSTGTQTVNFKKGFKITITKFGDVKEPLYLYKENKDVLKKAHEKLSKNQINYDYYSDSYMEGTITVDKDQIIYTSIPYDKDWIVTIDGKQVNTYKITDSFIGFDCDEGTHNIKLEYKTNYTIPTIISVTTFISLIVHEIIKRKQKKDTNLA